MVQETPHFTFSGVSSVRVNIFSSFGVKEKPQMDTKNKVSEGDKRIRDRQEQIGKWQKSKKKSEEKEEIGRERDRQS